MPFKSKFIFLSSGPRKLVNIKLFKLGTFQTYKLSYYKALQKVIPIHFKNETKYRNSTSW